MTSEEFFENEWFNMKYIGKYLSEERLLTLERTIEKKDVCFRYNYDNILFTCNKLPIGWFLYFEFLKLLLFFPNKHILNANSYVDFEK